MIPSIFNRDRQSPPPWGSKNKIDSNELTYQLVVPWCPQNGRSCSHRAPNHPVNHGTIKLYLGTHCWSIDTAGSDRCDESSLTPSLWLSGKRCGKSGQHCQLFDAHWPKHKHGLTLPLRPPTCSGPSCLQRSSHPLVSVLSCSRRMQGVVVSASLANGLAPAACKKLVSTGMGFAPLILPSVPTYTRTSACLPASPSVYFHLRSRSSIPSGLFRSPQSFMSNWVLICYLNRE